MSLPPIVLKRNTYDFNKYLKDDNLSKRDFIKQFYKLKEIFINDMLYKGILFFGFTINFPSVKDITDVLDSEEIIWDKIHEKVENFLITSKYIELIEFVYISIECHGERQVQREKKNKMKFLKLKMRNKL